MSTRRIPRLADGRPDYLVDHPAWRVVQVRHCSEKCWLAMDAKDLVGDRKFLTWIEAFAYAYQQATEAQP